MTDQSDALAARARSRVGQILCDKWRIDAVLGVGGMAAVYAATHTNNGRRAAIKLLHPELSAAQEVRARFLREGYLANKIEHPGTVIILDDHASDDGTVFLVMELLDGESLETRRERIGCLPPLEVLSLADRLLDVLAAAHDKGIVHRDVKPENIYLTRAGEVKILDFGIARILESSAVRLTLTTAGAIGTPAFMPQEQARGRWDDVGPRSDLWAVGATMFTLLTGRLVHVADTVNELMLAAMTKSAPPVASVAPSLPAAVASIVDRALSYEIDGRWSDARAMQAAVRAAYASVYAGSRGAESRVPESRVHATRSETTASALPHPPSFAVATNEPVTMVGRLPTPPRFPVLPIVGAIAGAVMTGTVLLLLVRRPDPPHAAADPDAGADVRADVRATSAVTPSASAPTAVSAALPTSATAPPSATSPTPDDSAGGRAKAPKPRPGRLPHR